jgi:hypothetical protein
MPMLFGLIDLRQFGVIFSLLTIQANRLRKRRHGFLEFPSARVHPAESGKNLRVARMQSLGRVVRFQRLVVMALQFLRMSQYNVR